MEAVVVAAVYMGLMVFALNGLVFMGLRQERYRIKSYEERLRRLYMRDANKLRRK